MTPPTFVLLAAHYAALITTSQLGGAFGQDRLGGRGWRLASGVRAPAWVGVRGVVRGQRGSERVVRRGAPTVVRRRTGRAIRARTAVRSSARTVNGTEPAIWAGQ